ncbi:hypothetical protein [Sphingomonas sp. SRS2]|uniref:hypothetical protein n=1 Tax=Sphingomonas sp. SRS2 TaxID=133190 RepID=UPI0006184C3D|nr:hypothetical protein [Sphingomonas sp. SRS2]KKC24843.1 hypothetical protein WP12_16520 [Sphingomonas sp. SRS2]
MTDTGGMSGGEAAAVVTASGGVLAILGRGIVWAIRHRRGRIARLEARVEQLAGGQIDYVRQVDCLVAVCFLLVNDIGQHRPDAPVIGHAKALIGSTFPDLLKRAFPSGTLPPDMLETILRAK